MSRSGNTVVCRAAAPRDAAKLSAGILAVAAANAARAEDVEAPADAVVDAPADARDQRAVRDRGWEPGEVVRREAAQMPLSTKRDRADVVISNDGDLDAVTSQAELALANLRGA